MIYLWITWLFWPFFKRRIRPEVADWRHVALVQTAKIGDMVCTLPLIEALSAHGTALDVYHAPLTTGLLAHDPRINRRFALTPQAWRGWAGKWALAQQLRAARYDAIVLASINLPWILIAAWAGIPVRMAVSPDAPSRSMEWARTWLTHDLPHQRHQLILDEWRLLLHTVGRALPHSKEVHCSPSMSVAALVSNQLGAARAVGLGISAGNTLKALDIHTLIDIVNGLIAHGVERVVLVGTAADQAIAAQILAGTHAPEQVWNSCGQFDLDEIGELLRSLALYVGVDSGMTYLADALGVPVVSVVGPTEPREQRPLDRRARFIIENLPCYPCAFVHHTPHHCHRGDRACITRVSAARVVEQSLEGLRE